MKTIICLLMVTLSTSVFGKDFEEVKVEYSMGDKKSTISTPLKEDGSAIFQTVWRGEDGIYCNLGFFNKLSGKPRSGTFECHSKTSYWAQTSLNCESNNSKEEAAFLFFGKFGSNTTGGNFSVWCE